MITTSTPQDAMHEATRVTLVGMWLDILLGVVKIGGGLLSNSFALVTDGIHSLTDAVSDVFVIFIARIGFSEADEEHPWGHGRFETLGTVAMGILFFTTAGIISYDAVQRLLSDTAMVVPTSTALVIAGISVVAKEWIFRYTMIIAKRLNSSLLKANAWHSRSDAISSIAVLIGVAGALLGYVWMDIVAALFIAVIIARIGWELCADALKELVDTAVPTQRREQIEKCILKVKGVTGLTGIRSRQSGGKILLEVRIQVSASISVSSGHDIGELVSRSLIGHFSDISDVVVHVDPDLPGHHSSDHDSLESNFPSKQHAVSVLKKQWASLLSDDEIESLDIHYQEHGLDIDLRINKDTLSDQLANQLQQAVISLNYIANLRIYTKAFESNFSH